MGRALVIEAQRGGVGRRQLFESRRTVHGPTVRRPCAGVCRREVRHLRARSVVGDYDSRASRDRECSGM
jgi:hypothetical protein